MITDHPDEIELHFATTWEATQLLHPFGLWLQKYYFRAQTHGLQHVPADQGVVYISQPPRSLLYLETLVCGAMVFGQDFGRRPFHVLVPPPADAHRILVIAWLRRFMGMVDHTAAAAVLKAGHSLLIFTGHTPTNVGATDSGDFASLAIKHRTPVVPLAMCGSDEQHIDQLRWRKQHRLWLPPWPLPAKLDFHFGLPLQPPTPEHADVQAFAEQAKQALAKLLTQGCRQQTLPSWQQRLRQNSNV